MSCFSSLDSEQQGLLGDSLKDVLDLIFWPAQPREVEKNFEIPLRVKKAIFNSDLVDAIDYSSGLRGHTESYLSVLDSKQQGLLGDGLKNVLNLIFGRCSLGKIKNLYGKKKKTRVF